MHPLTRRLAGGVLVAAAILATTVAAATAPASAEDGGTGTRGPIDDSGSRTGSGYTAAAALLTVEDRGTERRDMDPTCEVPTRPGEPAHVGRVISGPGPDGTYLVILYCDIDAPFDETDATATFTYFARFVTPLDPEELVENALANLNLAPPVIRTNPGDGLNSLTGLATYLWIDQESLDAQTVTDTDDPLSVEITAVPMADGRIVWDTGEGTVTCTNYGQPEGSCSYMYQRSSLDQPGNRYEINASVAFTGSYTVSLFDEVYRGPIDIGEVVVPTAPYLLGVAEAQAINTNP
ncbi:MAG TPA: hypothetical protein VFB94_05545 [Acidimicrobiales bacterium]|nr:hypothetical protein [Acidimicrobiales bacterium]